MSVDAQRELDDVYDVLGNARRRMVVAVLSEERSAAKGELAEHIAGEAGCGRETALIGLHQCHLPKMSDAGVVEYDERSGDVRPGELFDVTLRVMTAGSRAQGLVPRLLGALE